LQTKSLILLAITPILGIRQLLVIDKMQQQQVDVQIHQMEKFNMLTFHQMDHKAIILMDSLQPQRVDHELKLVILLHLMKETLLIYRYTSY